LRFLEAQQKGYDQIGGDKTSNHETNGGDQRRPLQITQPANGVTTGAAPRVTGAEAYQKATNHEEK
jgi:hypothetical protein